LHVIILMGISPMFRFTIRDVLWLVVVVGLALSLMINRQQASNARQQVGNELNRLTDIDIVNMTLRDTALFISVQHGVPVLLTGGLEEDRLVTAKFKAVPLRTALAGMLSPLGLDYTIKEGWILIEPNPR
jgi:hypothetical protein